MTDYYTGLRRGLTRADSENWGRRLEDLRAEQGSWANVAKSLGVSPATLRRYKAGDYSPGAGKARRKVDRDKLFPKISRALDKDRKSAIKRADFKRQRVKGRYTIARNPDYERRHTIGGQHMSDAQVEGMTDAWLSGDRDRVNRAWDNYLSSDRYIGVPTAMDDVESVQI